MPGQLSVKMSELTFPERRPCRPNAVHLPLDGVPVDPEAKGRQTGKELTAVPHALNPSIPKSLNFAPCFSLVSLMP
jgi:hypothetical protein